MIQTTSLYTKKLGRAVANEAKGTFGKYHLIPAKTNKWMMVADGSATPLKVFTSKVKAISFAKKHISSVNTGQIVIHTTEGKILANISN